MRCSLGQLTEIHTRRLRLIPLSLGQLRGYLACPRALEQDMGVTNSGETVTGRLRRAICDETEETLDWRVDKVGLAVERKL